MDFYNKVAQLKPKKCPSCESNLLSQVRKSYVPEKAKSEGYTKAYSHYCTDCFWERIIVAGKNEFAIKALN